MPQHRNPFTSWAARQSMNIGMAACVIATLANLGILFTSPARETLGWISFLGCILGASGIALNIRSRQYQREARKIRAETERRVADLSPEDQRLYWEFRAHLDRGQYRLAAQALVSEAEREQARAADRRIADEMDRRELR